jgi:ubiquitin C-terminal hydrolase
VAYNDILDHQRSQEVRLFVVLCLNEPSQEIDSFYPGPIENDEILETEVELKKNLFEGIDYVLLPEAAGRMLHQTFGGCEMITRKVVAKGTHYSQHLYVELYPIKFLVYLEKDVATTDNPTPVRTHFLSSSLFVDEAIQELYDSLNLRAEFCRVWIRKDPEDDDADEEEETDTSGGRKLTTAITDVDGHWRYLRNVAQTTLGEFNMVSVHIMIEQKVVNPRTGQTYWPKDEVLNIWKQSLRRGDLIDAQDEFGSWFESVVSSVNIHTKSITVHFKGWGKKFDRDIYNTQLVLCVAPLYSKTENWRDKLQIYDRVDYTKHSGMDQGRKWLAGYVMAIDHSEGRLKIKYKDDQLISEVDGVDLYGESICQMNTHVKSPVVNFATFPVTGSRGTTPASSSYSHVGYTPVTTATYMSSGYTPAATTSSMSSYTSGRYGSSGSSWNSRSHATGTPDETGAVGLYNLGNTCFMNSMLQCLSNTKLLTDCFLSDAYATQINTQNPLGHGGKLANSYARLLKEMWNGRYVAVSPDDFKRTIGEFAPQFSGYQQQDSQELMLFLLDGLHEDLNRVLKKPFVEKIESKGREDDLISREAWRRFLLRNDSELVDKCFGQLRSHVTCTNCGYQSVTFDEYSSLSLPLPMKNTVEVEVLVYPLPFGSVPIKLSLDVDGLLSVKDFKNLVMSKLQLRPDQKKRKASSDSRDPEGVGDFVMVHAESHSQPSPDAYDSDLADLGDKEEEEDVGGPAVLVSTSSRKTRRDDEMDQQEGGGFFHICEAAGTATGNGSRIFKTFEDRTVVKELARLREPCVMLELQHDAPAALPYVSAYPSSTPSQSLRYVDVLMGSISTAKSYYTNYNHTTTFDLTGPPHRFSYLSVGTTYGQVQELMWAVMKTYLHSDSPYQAYSPAAGAGVIEAEETESAPRPTCCPYDVYLTNSYGSVSKGLVTAKYDATFTLSPYEALICVWREDALKEEHFNEASLEAVVDHTAVTATSSSQSAGKAGVVNVLDCLNKFIEREQMPPEETWYCPECKQHLAPIKKFDVWTSPDVLIIHLKRFQYVPGVYFVHREKISDLIDFPITGLDLRPYVKSSFATDQEAPPIYDLYAVSEHIGGMGGGHYTATAMNPINKKWWGPLPPFFSLI